MSRLVASLVALAGNRRFITAVVLLLLAWISFMDSHSLLRRARWHVEAHDVRKANELLQAEILRLRSEVHEGIHQEDVERIARTEYGMSRPGEVVYRVKRK